MTNKLEVKFSICNHFPIFYKKNFRMIHYEKQHTCLHFLITCKEFFILVFLQKNIVRNYCTLFPNVALWSLNYINFAL